MLKTGYHTVKFGLILWWWW